MTKEELAKKKGLIIPKEDKTPAEKLVTTMTTPKEPVMVPERPPVTTTEVKRSVGKPKKRKKGDKKTSFWIDEDLVEKMYSQLQYGDSAGELINRALRAYLK